MNRSEAIAVLRVLVESSGHPEAVAAYRVISAAEEPTSERIEPGAEQAHRDDLARDVARLWMAYRTHNGVDRLSTSGFAGNALANALERLEAAYDFNAESALGTSREPLAPDAPGFRPGLRR